MEFHIWYLKEKGWIERTDSGGLAITVHGMEAVLEGDLLLRKDRLLPGAEERCSKDNDFKGENELILLDMDSGRR